MKLHLLDIPDDTSQTGEWLARKLVGLELGQLIAELRAVHPVSAGSSPGGGLDAAERLAQILGQRRREVLRRGLGGLSPQAIGQLLSQPDLLPELQELVLTDGGPYWEQLAESESSLAAMPSTEVSSPARAVELPARTPWHRRPSLVALATAASLLLLFFGIEAFRSSSAPPNPWGWNGSDALADNVSAHEYLTRLGDSANQWFDQQPNDAAELAKRIAQFRQGCSRLLLAQHRPLGEEDREWLRKNCRSWANTFDRYLAQVENGERPLRVRTEMDSTVRTLVKELRERAEKSQPQGRA